MHHRFTRISKHWQALGENDPLWAVYAAPGTRGGAWDVEEFFATGRREVDGAMAFVRAHRQPARHDTALDFGCGVGRLSRSLATYFSRVVAVDVSEAMLAQARELDATGGRVRFMLNQTPDLSCIADASIDLVYSSLVLQHLPKPLAAQYLEDFVRILAPGGVAVVQVATRPTKSVKGWAFRILPAPLTGLLQRRLLGYPAPMRMQAMPDRWIRSKVTGTGGRIVASEPDHSYGGHWISTRYLICRGTDRG